MLSLSKHLGGGFPLAAPFDRLRVTTPRKPAAVIAPFRGLGVTTYDFLIY